EAPEIVMLADMPMLPHHLAVPVILPQQAAAAAHVLRTLGKSAGPEQIAACQEISVDAAQRMLPLVHDVAAQVDQIGGLAIEGREQRVARGRTMLIADQKPELTMAHRTSPTQRARGSSSRSHHIPSTTPKSLASTVHCAILIPDSFTTLAQ